VVTKAGLAVICLSEIIR